MTGVKLTYETSQFTDVEPSILMDRITSYVKTDYKILERSDQAINIVFNNGSGLLWMSGSKRLRTIQEGKFKATQEKVTLTYKVDILSDLIFISIGIILIVFVSPLMFILAIPIFIDFFSRIIGQKNESIKIIKAISCNSTQPVITKI